jgi:hypothetical protein
MDRAGCFILESGDIVSKASDYYRDKVDFHLVTATKEARRDLPNDAILKWELQVTYFKIKYLVSRPETDLEDMLRLISRAEEKAEELGAEAMEASTVIPRKVMERYGWKYNGSDTEKGKKGTLSSYVKDL